MLAVAIDQCRNRFAVDNIDAILDVEGIAGIYVGPSDLSFSMSLPPVLDVELPQILKIFDELLKKCAQRNIFAGIHCASGAYAARHYPGL